MHVLIIGGGAAAVASVNRLLQSPHGLNKITVISQDKNIGYGLAYSTTEDAHILNIPAAAMSLPGELGFDEWLVLNCHYQNAQDAEQRYVARHLYGKYLNDIFQRCIIKASSLGIPLVTHFDEVIHLSMDGNNGFQLICHLGEIIYGDVVILCVGHTESSGFSELANEKNYFQSPWPFADIKRAIAPHQSVAVIGTRLSAIDVILGLKANRHLGPLYSVSRSGRLPRVKSHYQAYSLQVLTVKAIQSLVQQQGNFIAIEQVIALFCQELSLAYNTPIQHLHVPIHNAHIWLQREITKTTNSSRVWQDVLEAVYAIMPEIWDLLSHDTKAIFLNDYFTEWMIHVSAFPIDNARRILSLLHTGELSIKKGLQTIQKTGDHFRVSYESAEPFTVNAIINASGSARHIINAKSRLLNQLLATGFITPHPLGGILIDPHTLRLKNAAPLPCYAVGELTFGSCLAVTDMVQIMRQVNKLVENLQTYIADL